ncbi:hypothetical protein E2562_027309 [Oryza meyeriana var. granulata]|uniref:Uncharacterized protein n=1 Tax=Oryza meyeriana var. granulata TaxID=110450 RepID=A0A6G1C1V7_9ORYZ|nr:hypothetical protein E2562_027309 [Oryza meyeriana var. granulata]
MAQVKCAAGDVTVSGSTRCSGQWLGCRLGKMLSTKMPATGSAGCGCRRSRPQGQQDAAVDSVVEWLNEM